MFMQQPRQGEPGKSPAKNCSLHCSYVSAQNLNDSPLQQLGLSGTTGKERQNAHCARIFRPIKKKMNYVWIYQPVMVSSRTFSLVGFVMKLTTIMAMTAMTNA